MKKIICLFFCMSIIMNAFAQDVQTKEQSVDSVKVEKPKYWIKGLATHLGFSQVSLSNWAAGGYGSIALNAFIDGNANYKKDKYIWDNHLQIGYGFVETFGDGFKKSDDRIIFDSKFGYQAVEKLYFSAVYNFRTQFTKGYESKKNSPIVSDFFSPAYTSLGLGIDYKPCKNFSLNFAPVTGKIVMVSDKNLRKKYGNKEDQFAKWELGAQLRFDAGINVENFKAATALVLFSDYLDKPQNIKVNWDVNIEAKITKYLSATLRTYLIYDDAIKFIEKKDGAGNPVLDSSGNKILLPGIQFKELFSLSFTYTFGEKIKK